MLDLNHQGHEYTRRRTLSNSSFFFRVTSCPLWFTRLLPGSLRDSLQSGPCSPLNSGPQISFAEIVPFSVMVVIFLHSHSKSHLVALVANVFSANPNAVLGRKRNTGSFRFSKSSAMLDMSHLYFFA